jgi:hypothetical protein
MSRLNRLHVHGTRYKMRRKVDKLRPVGFPILLFGEPDELPVHGVQKVWLRPMSVAICNF